MSRAKQKINFFLLGLFAILILFIWLDLKKERAEQENTLLKLGAVQVQRIAIERRDRDAIVLQKQNGEWQITEPVQGPANNERITSLLRYLKVPASASFVADENKLAEYELEEPKILLRYNDTEIQFGDSHPISGERYILFNQQVHLVPDSIYHHLISSATDFYAAELFNKDAQLVSIAYPGHHFKWLSNQWTDTASSEAWSNERIATLAGVWRQARAAQVKPLKIDDYFGTVNLVFSDLSRLQLDIISVDDELILANSKAGVQYHFASSVLPHLLPELHKLED